MVSAVLLSVNAVLVAAALLVGVLVVTRRRRQGRPIRGAVTLGVALAAIAVLAAIVNAVITFRS